MCYSAQVWEQYQKYVKQFGADVDIHAFHKLYVERSHGSPHKIAKGMDHAFLHGDDTAEVKAIADLIRAHDALERQQLEQLVFAQSRRLADAKRSLETRTTRKATEDVRIATNKVAWAKAKLATLARTQLKAEDNRIFPQGWAPVLVHEQGRPVVRPMRYQCRLPGKPEAWDRKYPGTYNARRDNLEGYWKPLFGHRHALLVAERFYENVEGPDGENRILEFQPRDGSRMHIACLWSRWQGPNGETLDSFAAITDAPEPEVAAAGHDRTVINLQPGYIDAWLSPDPSRLDLLYAMFDDRAHPFYEHRIAA